MEVLVAVDAARMRALRERDEFFWLDLEAPSAHDIEVLGDVLGLHELAQQDSRTFNQEPKVDDFGDHLLIVFYGVRRADDDPERELRPLEVHVYVGGDFAATVHRHPAPALAAQHEKLSRQDARAEGMAIYRILRALCDSFREPLRELAARIDAVEAAIFTRPRDAQLETLYHLKQEVHELERRLAAQRDTFDMVTAALERLPGLSQDPRPQMRDVGDQLREVAGELDRHHEDITTLVHLYFNANQERLTTVATRLTILATFFLAWTLVTGFFGQNFKWLTDSIASRSDFLVFGVGGLVAATAVAGIAILVGRVRP